eukprot:m.150148 g.150148  ORF g.150148 m.150148 type:complete len:726 (+) comp11679_c4_seq2:427-2604(+)
MASASSEPTEADREAIRRLLPFAVGLGSPAAALAPAGGQPKVQGQAQGAASSQPPPPSGETSGGGGGKTTTSTSDTSRNGAHGANKAGHDAKRGPKGKKHAGKGETKQNGSAPKSPRSPRNAKKAPHPTAPKLAASSGTLQCYTRDELLALRRTPLVKPPANFNGDLIVTQASQRGSGGGASARDSRDNSFARGFGDTPLQFRARDGAAGRGRGRTSGGTVSAKGSAAFVPFDDPLLRGKQPPPALGKEHKNLRERVDAIRTTPASARSAPQSNRHGERMGMDPRETRGGPRDPSWGRGAGGPAAQAGQQQQQQRGRNAQQGRRGPGDGRGGRPSREENEPLPEWANETFNRDDMLTLGGFDDIDDSNLPDFFKKTPSAPTAASSALEGSLEGLDAPLEPTVPKAPVEVTEKTFFGESPTKGKPKNDDSQSKFSRFFAADDDNDTGPSEADIPAAPWSTGPADDASVSASTSTAPLPHPDRHQQAMPAPHAGTATDDSPAVAATTAPTGGASVNEDRASLMRFFGNTPAASVLTVGRDGTPQHAAAPSLPPPSTQTAAPPHTAPPIPVATSTLLGGSGNGSGSGGAQALEADRSNLMKLFGGSLAPVQGGAGHPPPHPGGRANQGGSGGGGAGGVNASARRVRSVPWAAPVRATQSAAGPRMGGVRRGSSGHDATGGTLASGSGTLRGRVRPVTVQTRALPTLAQARATPGVAGASEPGTVPLTV